MTKKKVMTKMTNEPKSTHDACWPPTPENTIFSLKRTLQSSALAHIHRAMRSTLKNIFG